jgi:nicotinamide riboside kinase
MVSILTAFHEAWPNVPNSLEYQNRVIFVDQSVITSQFFCCKFPGAPHLESSVWIAIKSIFVNVMALFQVLL